MTSTRELLEVHVLGEGDWLGASEVCHLCRLELDALIELADLGVVAPRGLAPEHWELPARELPRLRVVGRLIHDLGVNVSGAALAVELLDAQQELERRLRSIERLLGE